MASYLGVYENCASDRVNKFHRAINSFINQDFQKADIELIISSDGCEITDRLYYEFYSEIDNIKIIKNEKQLIYSGKIRQFGVNLAKGEVLCFLDTDDVIGKSHLTNISIGIKNSDWCYWDDYISSSHGLIIRPTILEYGCCGTSTIAYKKKLQTTWEGCDGYGHDFTFIQKLLTISQNYNKIYDCQYYCHHVPNYIDL